MVISGSDDRTKSSGSSSASSESIEGDAPPASEEPDTDREPWLLRAVSIDGPDPPWHIDLVGQIGVYLGILSVTLALLGVLAASWGIQPIGNVAIVLSLALISIAMVLGIVFQVYVGDVPDHSNESGS